MSLPQKTSPTGDIMEAVLIKGDLSKLTPEESVQYYNAVCKSLGLNPLTRPLEYMTLQGKRVLYCRKDGTDQLRKLNGISVQIVSQELTDDILTVHVKARDRDGREDEDIGAVSFPEGLRGEVRANTILKCVTKAKRRVTLSISGLGFLDETEVEDIPAAAKNGNDNGVKTNGNGNGHLSPAEREELNMLLEDAGADSNAIRGLCTVLGVQSLDDMRPRHLPRAKQEIADFKRWKAQP